MSSRFLASTSGQRRCAQQTAELIWQAWDDERTKATTATERKFRVGDLVYVLRTGRHKDRELGKLANKWKGPYRITSLPVNGAARLETMDGQKSPKLVNLGHLCKCHAIPEEGLERAGGEVHTSHNETPEQRDDWRSQANDQTQHERGDDAETEDPPDTQHDLNPKRSPLQGDDTTHASLGQKEMEAIIGERRKSHGRQFLVQWKGLGDEHNTWQYEEDLPAVVIYVNKKLPPTECATLIPSTLTDPATGFSAPTDVVERAKTGPSGEDMGELGATGSLLKKSTARFDDDMSAFDDL
ncbi:hypothetical protein Pelo_766 [Pelomyxa schiedti]|nr:hypothetical protein Pelo_766 [Pelomyxa schiedti]